MVLHFAQANEKLKKKLQRPRQAFFLNASSPDSFPPNRFALCRSRVTHGKLARRLISPLKIIRCYPASRSYSQSIMICCIIDLAALSCVKQANFRLQATRQTCWATFISTVSIRQREVYSVERLNRGQSIGALHFI